MIRNSRRPPPALHTAAAALLGCLWTLALIGGVTAGETTDPFTPLPFAVPGNAARVVLGERLFRDPRLSRQSRNACATCHPLERAAMDGRTRAESAYGDAHLRNTPSLFNVAFNFFFNWDGSVTTLESHAEKVLLNPRIMNTSWPDLLAMLETDPGYVRAFHDAYPDGLTHANLLDALASFERSLVTPNSRFDRYLRGEKGALSTSEEQGYRLFKSLGCVACHQGINLGGNLFQKFGIFSTPRETVEDVDTGRYEVTGDRRDHGVFRVPSLRNVAVTSPYFHDGRATSLEDAVDTMAQRQLGKRLTVGERGLIVQFLSTLTGEYQGKPVDPRVSPTP